MIKIKSDDVKEAQRLIKIEDEFMADQLGINLYYYRKYYKEPALKQIAQDKIKLEIRRIIQGEKLEK